MNWRHFLILILIISIDNIVFAQNFYEYFNYSPRLNQSLDLSIIKKIKQDIKIFDDNLGKIFIWTNNPVGDSSIEVKLLKNDTILANKTLTIPKQEEKLFGNKLEINLGNNLKIKSGEIYKLDIKHLNGKGLNIFYANKIQLLQAEEKESIIPKFLGAFYINDSDFPYNLKLALGEFPEDNPPEIFNAEVYIKSPYSVSILFNANEPIKYKLVYSNTSTGDSFIYSSIDFELCHPEIKKCIIDLFTQPNTNYYFQLTIFDYWGNFRIYEGNFKTPTDPNAPKITLPLTTTTLDTEPPQILNFQIKDITHNNINIFFQTNELAKSSIKIFYKETGVIVLEIKNPILNLYHEFDSKNLLFPNLEYFAIITAEDLAGNQKEMRFEFKTKPGNTTQTLGNFLSNPKTIEENKINYNNYEELQPINLSASYNTSSNQFSIKNESNKENLEALFLNRSNYLSLSYQIKDKDYTLDLNVLSPGIYSYAIYEKFDKNTKRIIKTGELEIKHIKTETEVKAMQRQTENRKTAEVSQQSKGNIEIPASQNKGGSLFRYTLLGIMIILIFTLILIKFKK